MLKGVPSIISPDLIKILMEMGHGDEIVLADGNFPAARLARRLVRYDGQAIPELLRAILTLIPLDSYTDAPAALMETLPGTPEPIIWSTYREILKKDKNMKGIAYYSRFSFYEKAREAYAIVATGEKALYAGIILTKGIFTED